MKGASMDTVRVLRIVEISGPRDRVEETVARSVTYKNINGLIIRAATIGAYPEILEASNESTAEGGE